MKSNARLWALVGLAVFVLVVVLVGTKAAQIVAMIKGGKAMQPPPESVASAKVAAQPWQGSVHAVGTLVAVRGVTLASELPGLVREITFESGSSVKQGAPLVRLDTSAEEAQLAAARADAQLARITLDRTREIRKEGSGSQADMDAAQAHSDAAAAQVAALQAVIAKKTIRAPFDGRFSIRQVELGQVLPAGAPIASLQSVTPIHAEFWLPQQSLTELSVGQKVEVRSDVFPNEVWKGELTTVNPEVDASTRNVRVRATVENPDGRLRPGMFATVQVLTSAPRDTLVVPATSVLYAPYGDSVYVIEEKEENGKKALLARQRFIRLGERRGDFVAVSSGLSAGESIVSAGAFKLRNGMAVALATDVAPAPDVAPTPANK